MTKLFLISQEPGDDRNENSSSPFQPVPQKRQSSTNLHEVRMSISIKLVKKSKNKSRNSLFVYQQANLV